MTSEYLCTKCGTRIDMVHDQTNVCAECGKAFCEDCNTVGNQWNGKDRETEHLSDKCEECAVGCISAQADHLADSHKERDI